MTTDTHRKEIAVELKAGKSTVRMGGICKGAGMIQRDGDMLDSLRLTRRLSLARSSARLKLRPGKVSTESRWMAT